ncbi:MFS transporter [Amycolatopsis sp. 195334CR]|uniref:MFS transporter n=1 Tax=Amycolatopsis sp. 195334CR TaxID=2814588 RepID=UPI001A900530|nr:MFS transporter [Amycolatopsis sp. 195334CR]MBN6033484.1 MFS transporter [Amycolatopsis sp. 195334CR]
MSVLPQPGPPRVLALAQLINSFGDGAFYVTSALYFTRVVGLSATEVGFGLTAGWAAGFLASVPLGALADRRGPKATAVVLALATAAAVGAFVFIGSFVAFVLAACVYASMQCGLSAARQALLAALVDQADRTATRAYLQSSTNAGLAVGAALGGLALYADTRGAYLAVFAMDVAGFLAAALLLLRLPPTPPGPARSKGEPRLAVLRDKPYALVSLLNLVMQLHIPMIGLAIPLWIVERTQAPSWTVSGLLVLNTVSVVLLQVRVARRVTSLTSASRTVRYAGVLLLASCGVFAFSAAGTGPWTAALILLGAAALQVLGEMMQASGAWEISFALAPDGKHGQYQGFFGSGFAVARMIGPLVLTTLVLSGGTLGWLVLGGAFLTAGLAMGPAVRWAAADRPLEADGPQVLVTARR